MEKWTKNKLGAERGGDFWSAELPRRIFPANFEIMANDISSPAVPVNYMMENDGFSQWMGLSVEKVERGYCLASLRVRADMLNGFYILHGGVAFALADSAMAFAANTYGQLAVVTDAHIQFPAAAKEGDELMAEAKETARTRKTAYYEVTIKKKGADEVLAKYQGSVYISSRPNPPA